MAWPSPTIMCALSVTGELCLTTVDSWPSAFGCDRFSRAGFICFQGEWQLLQRKSDHWMLPCSHYKVKMQFTLFNFLLNLSTGIKQWDIIDWTYHVIPAQAELAHQKILFLQPQSTPDPFCVSLPAKGATHYTWYEWLWGYTNCVVLFSSALLYIPPCPSYGEIYMSFHAEQVCTGLWCGGSHGGICSWKL